MLFPDRTLTDRLQRTLASQHISFMTLTSRTMPDLGAAVEPLTDDGGLPHAVSGGAVGHFTRTSGLGIDSPATAAQLDRAEAFHARRGEPCRVDVCPLSDPSLLELVRARNYTVELFDQVYARPIPHAAEDLAIAPGVRIAVIAPDDHEEADRTVDAVFRGFHGASATRDQMWRMARQFPLRPTNIFFAAYLDGVDGPVGGGSLDLHAEPGRDGRIVAALAGAATDERYRNRGVQTSLLRARLAHARRLAADGVRCDVAMILTRPGIASERNILRAGFQLVCSRARFARAPHAARPVPAA